MKRICIFLTLYMFTVINCPVAFAALEKSSKKECAMCHVMWLDIFRTNKETLIKWQPGNVLMKDTQGIVSSEDICYSCHDGYVADSRYTVWKYNNHTTFKKPSKNVRIPDTLTLSVKDEIYCGTCHTPHSGREAAPGSSPEETVPGPRSFLRVANTNSGLCESCHVDKADYTRTNSHPVHTDKLKIPEKLFEAGSVKGKTKDTVICQTCHRVHGAKGRNLIIMDNSQSDLCMTCHEQRSISGTQHDLRVTMPNETNIKGQPLSESGPCGACHVPHNSAGYRLWARKIEPGEPVSQLCVSCHNGKPGSPIKSTGRYSHPNNIDAVSKDDRKSARSNLTDKLPFFSQNGTQQPQGKIQCFTCHNVHQWDPATPENRGGKDAKGDAGNSFLRISNSHSSALCLECHKDKQQILSYDHNLSVTAPEAKNILGLTASVSGPCGACHIPHNAAGPRLWAREIFTDQELLPQYCLGCHNKNGPAKDKLTGENDHPVNVAASGFDIAAVDHITKGLPLFAKDGGINAGDTIRCLTCHDPHQWNPLNPGPATSPLLKNVEGDASNSFLRKANAPSSLLCEVCHEDNIYIEGTDHDLSVTAPTEKNLFGQTVKESGVCSACHAAHNSPNDLKLWARPYGPISPDNHPMDKLCTSCHSKGNIAEAKVPLIATHPKGKLIENVFRFKKENREYKVVFDKEALTHTPIFDDKGKRVNVGNLSCPSCHNAHQWDDLIKKKGSYRNIEGDATTSFLRNMSYNNVCVACHGQDALFRYRYFHIPGVRSGLKGAMTPEDSP